jgi:hypothetical protein
MFEGRPLIVTAQLEASQVELTVLHKRNGAFFDLTRLHFCVPADSIQPYRPARHPSRVTCLLVDPGSGLFLSFTEMKETTYDLPGIRRSRNDCSRPQLIAVPQAKREGYPGRKRDLLRHPIYSGFSLAAFGWSLLWNGIAALIAALLLLAFFDIKSPRLPTDKKSSAVAPV